jgi:coenzyme F420-reducing hydrogenase beta subunit
MPDRQYVYEVTVIGGTFSGNKGAAGMLEATISDLRNRLSEPVLFNVISVYPKADRKKNLPVDVRLVAATPPVFVLMLPPLALLYGILRHLHLPRSFLLKFKPLRAIVKADLVLDVCGISFADDRGMTLLYNLACNLPALFAGTPQIKLSQALGPFRKPINRAAARLVLPRLNRVFARGAQTASFLRKEGFGNWVEADDLAFLLGDAKDVSLERYKSLSFLQESGGRLIGVAPSQVVDNYLKARNGNLSDLLEPVLQKALEVPGTRIVILAHSMLSPESISKNNDYHVASELGDRFRDNPRVFTVLDDLTPVELRAVIGRCTMFIACRFHAMVSALCAGTPVLVVAWSHKYIEVMKRFGLESYVADYSDLSPERLWNLTDELLGRLTETRDRIGSHLPEVIESAGRNIEYTACLLRSPRVRPVRGAIINRLYSRFYEGVWKGSWTGFSRDPDVREGAASGGAVSSLLLDLLAAGKITGAVVARSRVRDGKLKFETYLASSRSEILDSRTSIYSDFNHTRPMLELIGNAVGSVAVVALPCQLSALESSLNKQPELAQKVFCKVALWCGHCTRRNLMDEFLRRKQVNLEEVDKLFYRRGLWRGRTEIVMKSGETVSFPFSSGYGLLQNLYVDCCRRCLSCTDHFGRHSDVSFGDAWLPELKRRRMKYSMALAHTDTGKGILRDATENQGCLVLSECDRLLPLRAQKRAVIWHTHNAAARASIARLFGMKLDGIPGVKPRLRDYPAAFLILLFVKWSESRLRPLLFKIPRPFLKPVMLVQKFFLNS